MDITMALVNRINFQQYQIIVIAKAISLIHFFKTRMSVLGILLDKFIYVLSTRLYC